MTRPRSCGGFRGYGWLWDNDIAANLRQLEMLRTLLPFESGVLPRSREIRHIAFGHGSLEKFFACGDDSKGRASKFDTIIISHNAVLTITDQCPINLSDKAMIDRTADMPYVSTRLAGSNWNMTTIVDLNGDISCITFPTRNESETRKHSSAGRTVEGSGPSGCSHENNGKETK